MHSPVARALLFGGQVRDLTERNDTMKVTIDEYRTREQDLFEAAQRDLQVRRWLGAVHHL